MPYFIIIFFLAVRLAFLICHMLEAISQTDFFLSPQNQRLLTQILERSPAALTAGCLVTHTTADKCHV